MLTSISYRAKARKRDAARAANGSALPAAPLLPDCPAGWKVLAGAPWPLTGARLQAAGLTPQQVRRVQHLPAIYTR